jgi:hypothetical protein
MSRRTFVVSGIAAAGALSLGMTQCDPAIVRRLRQAESRRTPSHGVWTWQFSIDGPARDIIDTLSAYGLSAIVKTHDGAEWMATYDRVEGAIAGPRELATVAAIFEQGGVPFHAWAVVHGEDPEREAEMAAQALDAGARSLTLDLEEGDGFWRGTREGARRFGELLRERQPFARVDVSIDPRPWKLLHVPVAEFVQFCDAIRPQLYWDMFDDEDHARAWAYFGFAPPDARITPEFLVDATHELLAPYDRWILPAAHADAGAEAFARFLRRCRERRLPEVSAWRYGIATSENLAALAADPPQPY